MALSEDDYRKAAEELGAEVAAIKAVAQVEAPKGPFLPDGRLTILFEAHKFSFFTRGKYDESHPHISSPTWNRKLYKGGAAEWDRLEEAISLDRAAALLSASYGAFQIMGFNHGHCGYTNVEEFVAAMKESEQKQLMAFLSFIKSMDLDDELQRKDWNGFARGYNGKAYKANGYHLKLARVYEQFRAGEKTA